MTTSKKFLLGVALSGATIFAEMLFPPGPGLLFLAFLLAALGGLYAGFALMDGRPFELAMELGFLLVIAFVCLGSLLKWPLLLAAGFFAHGLWDFAHHWRFLEKAMPSWIPPFCVAYDWAIAAFIAWRWGFGAAS